jgi:hypothetical protein
MMGSVNTPDCKTLKIIKANDCWVMAGGVKIIKPDVKAKNDEI